VLHLVSLSEVYFIWVSAPTSVILVCAFCTANGETKQKAALSAIGFGSAGKAVETRRKSIPGGSTAASLPQTVSPTLPAALFVTSLSVVLSSYIKSIVVSYYFYNKLYG